jgi:hypothetical protein
VQARGALHDMPARVLSKAGAGLAAGSSFHWAPFQASVSSTVAPFAVWYAPTAVQAPGAQDTAFSQLPEGEALGAGWMAQLRPFHRCASGSSRPVLWVYEPTAVQARGAVHDTPRRTVPTGLAMA